MWEVPGSVCRQIYVCCTQFSCKYSCIVLDFSQLILKELVLIPAGFLICDCVYFVFSNMVTIKFLCRTNICTWESNVVEWLGEREAMHLYIYNQSERNWNEHKVKYVWIRAKKTSGSANDLRAGPGLKKSQFSLHNIWVIVKTCEPGFQHTSWLLICCMFTWIYRNHVTTERLNTVHHKMRESEKSYCICFGWCL